MEPGERMEKNPPSKWQPQNSRCAVLISDKMDFNRLKKGHKRKDGYFYNAKGDTTPRRQHFSIQTHPIREH